MERAPDPMEDEEINATITGLTCARAMADATMRYIERREFVYEEEQRRIAEAENELDVNEGVESMELPRKKSSKAIHREFVGSLKLDRPIARGISLRKSLWARPWTFPKVDRKAKRLWHSAKRVELFDIFISHVWRTSWSLKFTSLILQSCWIFMLTAWVFVATLVFLLCFLGLLPLGWRYEAEALDTVVECKLGPWIVGFSMPACLLGLLLAPCLPEVFFTHVCFFDAASIYHADAPLKKRSFEALGGFISISKELRALWTPDFANRLWCIFEVAAFRKINPEGRIVIAPLSIEVFVAMLMPVTTAYGITFMFVLAARQTVLVGALASSIAAVPVGYGVHLLRREMQSKKDMLTCLDRFDLDKVECDSEEDRRFLYSRMTDWFGSPGAFEQYVRVVIREELSEQLSSSQISAFYYFFPCIPLISVVLDFLVGFIRAGIPAPWEVSFVISVAVGFGLWVSVATALLLNSCHFFSAPSGSWIWDVTKTSLIVIAWAAFQIGGLLISILCHMTSIWAVFAWSCSALLLFRLFLRCVRVG